MAEQVFAVDLDEAAENESFTLLSFVVARRWRLLWNYFPYTLCLLHSLRSALYLTKPLNKQFMFFSTSLYTFWLHEIFTGEGKEEPREKGAEEASERNFSSLLPLHRSTVIYSTARIFEYVQFLSCRNVPGELLTLRRCGNIFSLKTRQKTEELV